MINNDWSQVYQLAETYSQQQQWNQATVAFQRAIELRPDFFWSWHNLGDALTKLQQWDEAAKVYRQAVDIDPNFFWSWHNLGDALTKLQQWDEAIAIYLQALIIQPNYQLIYQKLGTLFKQRGSLEESIQYYRRIIQSSQQDNIYHTLQIQPEILLQIATGLVNQHQTHGAIVVYYMALEIQPNLSLVVTKLAQLLEQKQKLDRDLAFRQQNLKSELIYRQTNTNHQRKKTLENFAGKVIVKTNVSLSANILETLCYAVGWSSRPVDLVQKSLDNSFCLVTVWYVAAEKQELIGFGRAVSDGALYGVLLDILVHPHFQNLGLGKKIVRALIQKLQESQVRDITLFASPHVVDFYHKLGFVSQPNNLQWMLFSNQ